MNWKMRREYLFYNETMKHLLQYIILCLLVALSFAGCRDHSPVADKLLQAETCMNEYPDSALTILKSISHPERLTGQAQADYALLFSFAQYRCNHTLAFFSSTILAAHSSFSFGKYLGCSA